MTLFPLPILRRAIRRMANGFGRTLHIAAMLLSTVAASVALSGMALADDDLPGRVGRVADFGGELFLAPQDKPDQWVPIGINYPVTGGDNLWVGNDGRAEIDFGSGQFRLAGDTNLHVSRLDDREFALFVAQGRVNVRVRVLEPGETARIDTPNTQVVLTRPGLYRVDVSNDREHTELSVREGEANVLTAGAVQQVLPGQTAVTDGAEPRFASVSNGVGTDGFDSWAASRDRRYDRGRAGNYVSPQMVGAADLDQYGTWSQTPEYGAVWYPSDVGADWAPYRNGYWTEVGAWGPTWVDYAPWGYAPFHYGRWAHVGGRWGWCPGAYVARPLWAPALVGWAGGSGWSLSVSAGAPVYGWVPLAWGEPYRPWWGRCSNGCWERYNRPYAVNVAVRQNSPPTRYVNWNAPGGITAVAGSALIMRQPVQANLVRVPGGMAASAPVLASAPLVRSDLGRVPTRRPGDGAPPPASTFYPTIARPGVAPAGVGALPNGATTFAPSQTVRSRQAPPSAVAPPSYLRPGQPSPALGVAPGYTGPSAAIQPYTRAAPPAANPNATGVTGNPGSGPIMRSEPRNDQRPSGRPMQQTPAAVAVPPLQSYAAPQPNAMVRQQQQPQPQARPQPPVQQQSLGTPMPASPMVRSMPAPPAAPVAAPVHVQPPPAAAPSPPREGGNINRNGERGAPRDPNADRPSGR
jgi:hypothetical protein